MKAFGILELLLGDVRPLTLPQRFYQRALAGDPHEIIANARVFLKSNTLARYCDRVLLPALHLARLDAEPSAPGRDQHRNIRRIIVEVKLIATKGEYASWRATRATGDFDLRTFSIRAYPVDKVPELRPGMSAYLDWRTRG